MKLSAGKISKVVLFLCFIGAGSLSYALWEGFYKEKSVATPYTSFNTRSFLIHGKPLYIYAGEIHYPRVPKELWRDRLMRIKRAGYNTVAFYNFWNFHEPKQGEWHFEDNLDVDAWLTLIKEMGLYSMVRPGPYICAETDFGGFASWTVDVPGISYRTSDPEYLEVVDDWYEGIFPTFIKHQIHKGGSVIAVQLENEYWDSNQDEAYKNHLVNKALNLGLEVPYIWSMCINTHEPDPGTFPNNGSYPWFATELWTGWIQHYATSDRWPKVHRAMKKIVAAGTGGLTHYMMHGGTNFGYSASDDQRTTSYDYGAPIGELGQFRETYRTAKKLGWLARSFNDILATSSNGSSMINSLASSLKPYVHKTNKGNIAFVYNTGSSTASFKVTWKSKSISTPTNFNWSLAKEDLAYFVTDVPVTGNATIDYSATGILGIMKLGKDYYFILYGKGSSKGEIAFKFNNAPSPLPSSPWQWDANKKLASIQFTYPNNNSVVEHECSAGNGESLKLLVMNGSVADRTWIDSTFIVTGAEYVDENSLIHFTKSGGTANVYTAKGKKIVTKNATSEPADKSFSSGWKWISAAAEAATGYNDGSWQSSTNPKNMTAYGWCNGYGWYRTTHTANQAGSATFSIPQQGATDKCLLFVNGKHAGTRYCGDGKKIDIPVQLKQGANSIAVCMGEYSRNKAFAYYRKGPKWSFRSGMFGTVKIGTTTLTNWRFRGGFEGVVESPMTGTISSASWTALCNKQWSSSSAPNDNLPKFWRYDFSYTPPSNALATWVLDVDITSSEIGVVWLNGHCLGRNIENQPPLFVPRCWLKDQNTLIVFVENGKAPNNYVMKLEEYRSFGDDPVGTIHTSMKPKRQLPLNGQNIFVASGERFFIPREYSGKKISVTLYDLSGRCIQKNAPIQNGAITIGKNSGFASGIFVIKINLITK